ncbi:MAG: hypothetical protein IJA10_12195 [Lachnospiraceae bacterium]|nr:hypothetical protein [Lachnospiraceae bacterium]
MQKKIRGLLLQNVYLNKRYIVVCIVISSMLIRYLTRDFLNEGLKELQMSANIYGFIVVYLIAIFTNKFYQINNTQNWKGYLQTISKGSKSSVVAKYLNDMIFLSLDILIVFCVITYVLQINKVSMSIEFYYGILVGGFVILINSGIDNMISFLYNKLRYKVLLYIIMIAITFTYAYVIIVGKINFFGVDIRVKQSVVVIFCFVIGILLNFVLCKFTTRKIVDKKIEEV